MSKKIILAALFISLFFIFSACGNSDSRRIEGTWTGLVGEISMMAWRYEFNRDGTGSWGDARAAAAEQIWDWDLGRYVEPWSDFNVVPTTWNITDNTLQIYFTQSGEVYVYNFEFLDDDTLVLTREGWLTGFELSRVE